MFFRLFLTVVILAPLACHCWAQEMPPKVVEVIHMTRSALAQKVRLFGTVRAKREVTLLTQVDGVLDTAWTGGRTVSKGDIFATLDNPELKKNFELAQSSEKIAFEQYNRAQSLLKNNLRSQKDSALDRAHWIEATQATLRAKLDFDRTQFKAPFDGVLGIFRVREGAYVQKGDVIVTLYDPRELVMEFDIPAKFLNASLNKALVAGRLYDNVQTQKVVDTQTNTAPAFIEITQCKDCVVGSVMDVDLVVKESPQALVVPADALFMESGKFFVFVVKNGKTKKRLVTTGIEDAKKVEIRTGLKEGEQVVSTNPNRLLDDTPVKVSGT